MKPASPPPLTPRDAALSLIQGAIARRGGLDEAIAGEFSRLEDRDRAFARRLAMITLRRWGQIEKALGARLASPPPDPVMALLRLGAAQALFTETPAHAAVSTIMDMAQVQPATRPFKGLINAVLRGLLREPPLLRPEDLAPAWLLARWQAAYGASRAAAIAATIAEEPATDISMKDASQALQVAEALQADILPGGSLRVGIGGSVSGWPGFNEGSWWVQDAAAAIPARLLDMKAGETALDLCAAPGGKTLQLAAAGALVTALDRSASRLKRLTQNLDRTRLTAEVVAQPAESWVDDRLFDAVLLDAPCSATGTFRRQPEVLWLARPPEIAKLALVQHRLLDAAASRVKPGGRLVYCVCSLEPEEGEAQARAFLARHAGFEIVPIVAGEAGVPAASVLDDGSVRLTPDQVEGGADGFYIARFRRTGP